MTGKKNRLDVSLEEGSHFHLAMHQDVLALSRIMCWKGRERSFKDDGMFDIDRIVKKKIQLEQELEANRSHRGAIAREKERLEREDAIAQEVAKELKKSLALIEEFRTPQSKDEKVAKASQAKTAPDIPFEEADAILRILPASPKEAMSKTALNRLLAEQGFVSSPHATYLHLRRLMDSGRVERIMSKNAHFWFKREKAA